jgi:predicted CoA-binding protein
MMNEPDLIRTLLSRPATIAVIGLSPDPGKPSHYVPAYMQQHGYRILPVNPAVDTVLGETCYPTLTDLPIKPDIVNVFRLPKYIPAIVEEMIQLGLSNLWIQSGIINREAAAQAEAAGIHVIMDRCIMVEHRHVGFH